MGSIVVAQEGTPPNPVSKEPQTNLALSSYGTHHPPASNNVSNTVMEKSLCQATENINTDVVFISALQSLSTNQYRLGAHKNVLATVDHFKTAFESGMKESAVTPVEFDVPPHVTKLTMQRFRSFVYPQDPSLLLLNYTIGSLSELIRVADYYGFEELIENASIAIEEKYSWLSDQHAIDLLKTVDSLYFSRKLRVEKFMIDLSCAISQELVECRHFLIYLGRRVTTLLLMQYPRRAGRKELRITNDFG